LDKAQHFGVSVALVFVLYFFARYAWRLPREEALIWAVAGAGFTGIGKEVMDLVCQCGTPEMADLAADAAGIAAASLAVGGTF
jgi:hypothetical protein